MMHPLQMAAMGRDAVRKVMPSRAECNAIHDQQHRPFINGHGMDRQCEFSPEVYLGLRFHPINIRLGWVMFGLGSVVEIGPA